MLMLVGVVSMKTAIVSIMMFPAIMLGGATTLRNPPAECSAPPLTVLSQYNNTYGCNAKSELFSSRRAVESAEDAKEHEDNAKKFDILIKLFDDWYSHNVRNSWSR